MTAARCPHFDTCSAPICPVDPASVEHAAWFPDEEICRRADHRLLPMVQAQKKIARLAGGDCARGCFTAAMLGQGCRLSRAVKGLDPEAGPITAERVGRWLGDHPQKRALTEEERAVRRARVAKMRAENTGPGADPAARTRAPETPAAQPDLFEGVGR